MPLTIIFHLVAVMMASVKGQVLHLDDNEDFVDLRRALFLSIRYEIGCWFSVL